MILAFSTFLFFSKINSYPNIESELKFNIQPVIDSTHFWDCIGCDCDLYLLKPWNKDLYRYSPFYSPLNPYDYGGPVYNENLWMVGAFSDSLSKWLGIDDSCCGIEPSNKGGCGKCILVTNPNAVNKEFKVLVMKKGRCYPETEGCGENKLHLKLLVPGYNYLNNLTNCDNKNTLLNKFSASICGSWFENYNNTIEGCNCGLIPNNNNNKYILKNGCNLFTSWGWKTNKPKLTYKQVQCPKEYINIISQSFGRYGPQDPFQLKPLYTRENIDYNDKLWFCSLNNCKSEMENSDWCSNSKENCIKCGGYICDKRL